MCWSTDDPDMGSVKIRIGFHSGPVVSNVVGSLNPRYGIFGDTVNVSSRMESTSRAGRVQCSDTSAKLLMVQAPSLPVKLRGKTKIKGKGTMQTYFLSQRTASAAIRAKQQEQIEQTVNRAIQGLTRSGHNRKTEF